MRPRLQTWQVIVLLAASLCLGVLWISSRPRGKPTRGETAPARSANGLIRDATGASAAGSRYKQSKKETSNKQGCLKAKEPDQGAAKTTPSIEALLARILTSFDSGKAAHGTPPARTLEQVVREGRVTHAQRALILGRVRDLLALHGGEYNKGTSQARAELVSLLLVYHLLWEADSTSFLRFVESAPIDSELVKAALRMVFVPPPQYSYLPIDYRRVWQDPKSLDLATVVARSALDAGVRRLALQAIGGLLPAVEQILRNPARRGTAHLMVSDNLYYRYPELLARERVALLEDLESGEGDETNKFLIQVSLAHMRRIQAGDTRRNAEERAKANAALTIKSWQPETGIAGVQCVNRELVRDLHEGQEVAFSNYGEYDPVGWIRVTGKASTEFWGLLILASPGDAHALVGKHFIIHLPRR